MCPSTEGVNDIAVDGGVTLTLSILGHIFTLRFVYNWTILLTLGRVYGDQKIYGHSLHHLVLHKCF
ncbi:hypothetical protein E2C01_022713 [Portunus trituberculatus]|uniref:Uncharacterized protein n=1 Tax=Portunus trituberculatus TaxID=210409 RepID=A0A5B7E7U5_PORTR|nr:hypothetical protein [Portunus trituberculatus]